MDSNALRSIVTNAYELIEWKLMHRIGCTSHYDSTFYDLQLAKKLAAAGMQPEKQIIDELKRRLVKNKLLR